MCKAHVPHFDVPPFPMELANGTCNRSRIYPFQRPGPAQGNYSRKPLNGKFGNFSNFNPVTRMNHPAKQGNRTANVVT